MLLKVSKKQLKINADDVHVNKESRLLTQQLATQLCELDTL